MNVEDFKKLDDAGALALELRALWWAERGDWDRAHTLCQEAGTREGDWVHGYLHRVEGDAGNARYWYARAGRRSSRSCWGGEQTMHSRWSALTRIADSERTAKPAARDRVELRREPGRCRL